MSNDFTWRPETSSRRNSLNRRVAIILVCAGLGVVAGSFYPIKLVVTAFERTSQSAQARKANVPSSTPQGATRGPLALAPGKPQPTSPEIIQAAPEAETRFVLLNPGSAEPAAAPQVQPAVTTPTEWPSPAKRLVSRQQPVQSATNGDRNVLVVVRRREAPYDTKVLHGRIRDGRLIVNARGMTIR
jgi:hypothetical protein